MTSQGNKKKNPECEKLYGTNDLVLSARQRVGVGEKVGGMETTLH